MTTWRRAIDDQGRLFTIAVAGNHIAAYYPDLIEDEFVLGNGNSLGRGRPVKYWRDDLDLSGLDGFKRANRIVAEVDATMTPGHHFPRMYRGQEHPPIDVTARTATMRAARNLFSRLRSIFQVVEPTSSQAETYGHELRQLLILACTEVESSWRAILAANAYPAQPERWTTKDYVKLAGPMRLGSYAVTLATHPEYGEIVPFDGWAETKPSQSLGWYRAYNLTKHNREEELSRASLRVTIEAMAAVHVMTVAQFGFDEVERGHFHADEFNFVRSPAWLGDAYIRPLLSPEYPLVDGGTFVEWPQEWFADKCPF